MIGSSDLKSNYQIFTIGGISLNENLHEYTAVSGLCTYIYSRMADLKNFSFFTLSPTKITLYLEIMKATKRTHKNSYLILRQTNYSQAPKYSNREELGFAFPDINL
jgi:hypothetical protein